MEEFKPFTIERPWGMFRQLTHNTLSTVKVHYLKPDQKTSLQSHTKRSEFWYIVSGDGQIIIGDKTYDAVPGYEYTAPVGEKHRWMAGAGGMVVVEVATGDFDEEDIIRYEDDYGRTS